LGCKTLGWEQPPSQRPLIRSSEDQFSRKKPESEHSTASKSGFAKEDMKRGGVFHKIKKYEITDIEGAVLVHNSSYLTWRNSG